MNQINNELCTMMETFNERINQQREQEAILEQELAAQRKQDLLKQAAQSKFPHRIPSFINSLKKCVAQKQEKELYCMHDSIEDLIGMAMNTMLLSINLKSQHLDKEKQEVKNIIDALLEEFSGELAYINLIPPGINKADFDPKEEIHLIEELLYDNSSPRPPEESNSEISDTTIKTSSPSPILVKDSDSHMEEIDLFLVTDDLMPPGIENDDYESEGDIHFLEELLSNDSPSLPENESSNLNHFNDPSSPCPPLEPPDVEIYLNFVPDIFDPGIFIEVQSERLLSRDEFSISFIHDTLSPVFDTLLSFSSENEDKVFKPGILSYLLVSHRDKISFDFFENPMMISGGDIPHLDVPFLHFYPP
ncbi:hypothetical protein Tco_0250423 [Tanacetum coccineum]